MHILMVFCMISILCNLCANPFCSKFRMSLGSSRWDVFLSFKLNLGWLIPRLSSLQVRGKDVIFHSSVVLLTLRLYWYKGLMTLFVLFFVLDGDWDKSRLLYSFLKKKLTLIIKVLNFLHYFYDFTCIIMLRVWKQPLRGQYTILHLSGTLGSWQTL